MKMRVLFVCAAMALLLVLTSCGLLTPQQQADALAAVDAMVQTGSITKAQADAMKEAILNGSQVAWWQQAIQVVGGAALAYAGVQWRRGPVATPIERVERLKAKVTAAPS